MREVERRQGVPSMAICPKCGFDLNATGACTVCGYGKQPDAARTSSARRIARPVWISAAGAVVLIVAAVVFFATAGRGAAKAPVSVSAEAAVRGATIAQTAAGANGTSSETSAASANEAADLPADPPLDSKANYVQWMLRHTSEKEPYIGEKWERTQQALARGDIRHKRVLMAFLLTPREKFVRSYNLPRAYADAAIPIGYGQTISGPHIVARMTDALDPQPDQRVLEIGTGSGYQSAFLSELSNHVYTIEIVKTLYEETDAIYASLYEAYPMYRNIHRLHADGYYGWPEHAPFDRIIVTAAIDHIPPDLLKQLAPGGVMVIPIGPPSGQVVLKITKIVEPDGTVRLEREDIYHGAAKKIFVPFTAEGGKIHSLSTDEETGR